MATAIPTDLTTGWQQALEHWNQTEVHDTVLGLAAKHKQFAWLATRYRDAARSNPSDDVAPARLERVKKAALVVAFSATPRPENQKSPFKAVTTLLLASVAAIGLGMWVADSRVRAHQHHATAGMSITP